MLKTTCMKIQCFFILFVVFATTLHAQKEYIYGSTGQQKLLINPAFSAGIEGIQFQTLTSSYPYPVEEKLSFANYTGISYRRKNLSFGLSNTYYKNGYYNNTSNQTDLSMAYIVRLNPKVTVIPSIQTSYYDLRKTRGNLQAITEAFHQAC